MESDKIKLKKTIRASQLLYLDCLYQLIVLFISSNQTLIQLLIIVNRRPKTTSCYHSHPWNQECCPFDMSIPVLTHHRKQSLLTLCEKLSQTCHTKKLMEIAWKFWPSYVDILTNNHLLLETCLVIRTPISICVWRIPRGTMKPRS